MITRGNYEIWMLDYVEGKLDSAQRSLFLEFLAKNPDLKKQLEAFDNGPIEKPLAPETNSFNLKKKQSWLLEKYSEEELIVHVSENLLNAEELREWNDLVKVKPLLLDKVIKEKQLVLKPGVHEKYNEKLLLKKSEGSYLITAENCATYFLLYADSKELALHKAIQTFLAVNPQYKNEFELSQKLVLKADTAIVFEEKESLKKKEKRIVGFYAWSLLAVAACLIFAAIFFYPAGEKPASSYAGIVDSVKTGMKSDVNENKVVPEKVIANDDKTNSNNNVALNDLQIKRKNKTEGNNGENKKEIVIEKDKIVPDKQNMVNYKVKESNESKKTDSTNVILPVKENPGESVANAKNTSVKNDKGLNPLEAVAKIINNKYYENETPKEQETSSFYAMKNMVHQASGGNADMSKKEDTDYKEFRLKIGDFKFSRKKNKNKLKED
jgi:hypothetical protein